MYLQKSVYILHLNKLVYTQACTFSEKYNYFTGFFEATYELNAEQRLFFSLLDDSQHNILGTLHSVCCDVDELVECLVSQIGRFQFDVAI